MLCFHDPFADALNGDAGHALARFFPQLQGNAGPDLLHLAADVLHRPNTAASIALDPPSCDHWIGPWTRGRTVWSSLSNCHVFEVHYDPRVSRLQGARDAGDGGARAGQEADRGALARRHHAPKRVVGSRFRSVGDDVLAVGKTTSQCLRRRSAISCSKASMYCPRRDRNYGPM